MFIIVSNNSRIPDDLKDFTVEQWSAEEFLDRASGDGIEIDEGIWYDVSYLTSIIYEGLKAYKAAGVNLVYYRFEDKPDVSFYMDDKVKIFSSEGKSIENETITAENTNETTNILNNTEYNNQPIDETTQSEPIQQQVVSNTEPIESSQPIVQQSVPVSQTTPQQPVYNQPVQQPTQNIVQDVQPNVNESHLTQILPGVKLADSSSHNTNMSTSQNVNTDMFDNMLQYDDYDAASPQANRKAAPAKVILFGSSKGGTGKTFTCLSSAYWYAKKHPTQRIALADFDIIDGQIGITINKLTPTMQNFYKLYKGGHNDFAHLDNCKVKSSNFSPNIDFYLAPSQDIPAITNDNAFWTDVFSLLITNYDVVFFDSGIDYLGKHPISQLYKIADKIIITCNPSINSVKSVIKQFKTLSGSRANNVFRPGDDIMSRINVVLTRVYDNEKINDIVVKNITNFAPVIAAFGNIDDIISQVQWYQLWDLIDNNPDITESLENITHM